MNLLFFHLLACQDSKPSPSSVAPAIHEPSPEPSPVADTPPSSDSSAEECADHAGYFLEHIAGPFFSKCLGCHNEYGLVSEVNRENGWNIWTGKFPDDPNYLNHSLDVFRNYGTYLANKASQNGLSHQGGTVFSSESDTHQKFSELSSLLSSYQSCESASPGAILEEGSWLSPKETLYKAAFLLTSRPPDEDSLAEVSEETLGAELETLFDSPEFLLRVEEVFHDVLLTSSFDPHILSGSALNNLPYNEERGHAYPQRFLFRPCEEFGTLCCEGSEEDPCCEDLYPDEPLFCELGKEAGNRSVARMPLQLIRHVVETDRPFSDILRDDHIMANPFVAGSYGLDLSPWPDLTDEEDYIPVQITSGDNVIPVDPVPQSGILSDHMFLRKYITTRTNLNRRRSRMVYELFLDIDIEDLAAFTVDMSESLPENPTLEGNVCRICHAAMDPVGGYFMYRDRRGAYVYAEGETWKNQRLCSLENPADPTKCLRDPAYKGEVLDTENETPLQVLADHIGNDPRFGLAITHHLFRHLLGVGIVELPKDPDDPDTEEKILAWQLQREQVEEVRQALISSGLSLRQAIKTLLLGEVFRLQEVSGLTEVQQSALQKVSPGGQLLTPEELHRKITELTGYPWRLHYTSGVKSQDRLLIDWQFGILYGGIDSDVIVQRNRYPNAVTTAIGQRMSAQMSCLAVPQDFSIDDPSLRRFFYDIEPDDDIAIPDNEETIRTHIAHLYMTLLGEEHGLESEEISAAYSLLLDVQEDGVARIEAGDESGSLPGWCRAKCEYVYDDYPEGKTWHYNCTNVPEELHYDNLDGRSAITSDTSYSIRAWQALFAALLSDYTFLYR